MATNLGNTATYFKFANVKGAGVSTSVDTVSIQKTGNASTSTASFSSTSLKSTSYTVSIPDSSSATVVDTSSLANTTPIAPTTGNDLVPTQSKYAHTADQIQETDGLHWLTSAEEDIIEAMYQYLKVHINDPTTNTPGSKTIVWVISPNSFPGDQEILIKFPYDGTISDVSAVCPIPGGINSISIIRCSVENFSSSKPWEILTGLNQLITTDSNSSAVNLTTPIAVKANDYFSVIINTTPGAHFLPIVSPLTIEVTIDLLEAS